MSGAKHTPGPGSLTVDCGRSILLDGKPWVHIRRSTDKNDNGGATPCEADSFTHLAATAPDLLEACRNAAIALRFYAADMDREAKANRKDCSGRSYPFGQEAERACMVAISKAEGGEK